ncbi:MAG: hypothetical protein ACFB4I_15605 [Cyanophyceae cyanobacterium]
MPFAVLLLLFLLLVFGIFKKLTKSKRKKTICRIINDGPQSLHEYLLIFPEACPCCGSRDWNKVFWKVDASETNTQNLENLQVYSQCLYCNYIKESFYGVENNKEVGKWYLEVGRKHYRVNSRYLSKEQEHLFSDWSPIADLADKPSDDCSLIRAKLLFSSGNSDNQQIVGHS